MNRFRNISIRAKLVLASMLPTVTLLVIAVIAFGIYDLLSFRSSLLRDAQTTARFIAYPSAASLEFEAPSFADNLLQGLRSKPAVTAACLYNAQGNLFSTYTRDTRKVAFPALKAQKGASFADGKLVAFEDVVLNNKVIGTVYLQYDLSELQRRRDVYLLAALLALVGFILLAWVLSNSVQGYISKPIQSLAQTARSISQNRDYSVRVSTGGNDEIGALTQAFNAMLNTIQQQDAALRESEERIRFALRSARVGSWDWDILEDKVVWSDTMPPLFGISMADFHGTYASFLEFVHPQDRDLVKNAVTTTIQKHLPYQVEFRVLLPDGSLRWLTAIGQVHYDETAHPRRMSGVILDFTEKRESQEKLQAAHDRLSESFRSMESFCYTIAHDLRAPLRQMRGFSSVLLEDHQPSLDPSAQSLVRRIDDSAARMDMLVRDLLEYGRLSSSELPMTKLNLEQHLHAVVERWLSSLSPGAAQVHMEGPFPAVMANPTVMDQILSNLLGNALKFVQPGLTPSIRIWATRQERNVRLHVEDNGIGIAPEHHERIFRVFERLPGPVHYPGTGIGLAVVKKGIERMGGRVGIQSHAGGGSCFWIELPVTNGDTSLAHSKA